MKKQLVLVCAAALMAVTAQSALAQNIAIVNGKAVPKARLDALAQQVAKSGRPVTPEVQAQMREAVIVREIFAQEAEKLGLVGSDDFKSQMEIARQSILITSLIEDFKKKNAVTDAELKGEYDKFSAANGGKEYKARHILVEKEAEAKAIIARGLSVPSQIVHWQAGKPLYNAMLSAGDRFIVTEDSASMLTEALLTDRPVSLFKLARQHEGWRRASAAWRMAALSQPDSLVGRSFNLLAELGMLSGVRDLGLLHEALETAGMLHGAGEPSRHAFEERTETLSRILQLVDGVQR